MEPRSLDTPEHAAYRAAILAHGQEDAEVKQLRAEIAELNDIIDGLEVDNADLQLMVRGLEDDLEVALSKGKSA